MLARVIRLVPIGLVFDVQASPRDGASNGKMPDVTEKLQGRHDGGSGVQYFITRTGGVIAND